MTPTLRTLASLAVLVLLGACVSQPAPKKLRYAIGAERPGAAVTAPRRDVLRIDRVLVSPLYEHKGFVYRTGDVTWASDYYNEFFAAPGVLVRETAVDWLAASGLFGSVVSTNVSLGADWMLEARVDKLYGDTRGAPRGVLAIEFTLAHVTAPGANPPFRRRYTADRAADDASAAGIVAAWNDGLAEILTAFEADLRAHLSR